MLEDPTGERRHEGCIHGSLTESWLVDELTGRETPTLAHLCHWEIGDCPPALARMWGGLIDPARDCAKCPVFSPLTGSLAK